MKMVEVYGIKGFLIDFLDKLEFLIDEVFVYYGLVFIEVRILFIELVNLMVFSGKLNYEMEGY